MAVNLQKSSETVQFSVRWEGPTRFTQSYLPENFDMRLVSRIEGSYIERVNVIFEERIRWQNSLRDCCIIPSQLHQEGQKCAFTLYNYDINNPTTLNNYGDCEKMALPLRKIFNFKLVALTHSPYIKQGNQGLEKRLSCMSVDVKLIHQPCSDKKYELVLSAQAINQISGVIYYYDPNFDKPTVDIPRNVPNNNNNDTSSLYKHIISTHNPFLGIQLFPFSTKRN